jgi:hypothetical protein
MKRFFLNLVMIPLVAIAFQSCVSTGHPLADIQTFFNSPAFQAELTAIQADAISFVNTYITSHFGAKRSASNSTLIQTVTTQLRAKYPGVPDVILQGAAVKAASGGAQTQP